MLEYPGHLLIEDAKNLFRRETKPQFSLDDAGHSSSLFAGTQKLNCALDDRTVGLRIYSLFWRGLLFQYIEFNAVAEQPRDELIQILGRRLRHAPLAGEAQRRVQESDRPPESLDFLVTDHKHILQDIAP